MTTNKLVPLVPTEQQWGGLARDIMMAFDLDAKTPRKLLEHLGMSGADIPAWLRDEVGDGESDSVLSKGTRAVIIYRAMVEAAPVAEQAQQAEPVAFGDDVVQYISQWGGHCRDCADNMGICHTGLPCGDGAKAITHVLSALAYGINNGFLPRIAAQPPAVAVAVPDAIELLREHQWAGSYFNGHGYATNYCLVCQKEEHDGHADDCKLAAVLAAAQKGSHHQS